jgi:hypothetical protein
MIDLLLLAVFALVVGAFARFALPGKDPMSIWQTLGVGAAGWVLAALVSHFLLGQAAGFLLILIFSTGVVYFVRRSRGGGLMDPGRPPDR